VEAAYPPTGIPVVIGICVYFLTTLAHTINYSAAILIRSTGIITFTNIIGVRLSVSGDIIPGLLIGILLTDCGSIGIGLYCVSNTSGINTTWAIFAIKIITLLRIIIVT
jgi:hypothetical protein